MSWDILLLRLPENITSLSEFPDDPPSTPIGGRDEVLAAIAKATPTANLSDPTWGLLDGEGWSIELNIGPLQPVDSVMLHVRGSGDDTLTVIFRLAEALGCRAFDCTDGELMTPEDTGTGWNDFQEYRDRVLAPDQDR